MLTFIFHCCDRYWHCFISLLFVTLYSGLICYSSISDVMSCHVMSCHVMSCHVMSCPSEVLFFILRNLLRLLLLAEIFFLLNASWPACKEVKVFFINLYLIQNNFY